MVRIKMSDRQVEQMLKRSRRVMICEHFDKAQAEILKSVVERIDALEKEVKKLKKKQKGYETRVVNLTKRLFEAESRSALLQPDGGEEGF